VPKARPERSRELIPITPFDWDFRRIADRELIACCMWEYARESRSLAFARERYAITMRRVTRNKSWGGLPADDAAFKRHVADTKAREKRARFDWEAFLRRFWESDVGFVKYYQSLRENGGIGTRPWRTLPGKIRRRFVRELDDRSVLKPLVPALVRELEALWLANNKHLLEVRARVRSPDDDSEDAALCEPTTPVSIDDEKPRPARETSAAFTIDFSRYSDTEILAAFTVWLRTNRPRRWRRPQNLFPIARRGKKLNDYRVALERLGLMRLLHYFPPRFLRSELPKAWQLYGGKQAAFRREVRGAVAFFRERFPFISKQELPASARRYQTWVQPILRRMEGTANRA
jgi:hypothetical protein